MGNASRGLSAATAHSTWLVVGGPKSTGLCLQSQKRKWLTIENRRWEFKTHFPLARSSEPLFVDSVGWFRFDWAQNAWKNLGGSQNVDENKAT